MAEPVLNAQVFKRDQLRMVMIRSSRRYRDPLTPYISTDEPSHPQTGGPIVSRARIVLPDATRDHVNAVALQFDKTADVDALILLLQAVQRELAKTYPTEDEMEGPS